MKKILLFCICFAVLSGIGAQVVFAAEAAQPGGDAAAESGTGQQPGEAADSGNGAAPQSGGAASGGGNTEGQSGQGTGTASLGSTSSPGLPGASARAVGGERQRARQVTDTQQEIAHQIAEREGTRVRQLEESQHERSVRLGNDQRERARQVTDRQQEIAHQIAEREEARTRQMEK